MNEKSFRKVPIKNYFILGLLFIIVILLLWYFSKWYQVYRDYQNETPVIRGTLSEITAVELDHYIMENPTTIIYLCTSSDLKCRDFEKSFKNIIQKEEDLKDDIIYVNLSDENKTEFVEKFNESHPYKIKLTKNFPAIVLFEDSKITGLLQVNDGNLNAREVRSYLHLHQIGEKEE